MGDTALINDAKENSVEIPTVTAAIIGSGKGTPLAGSSVARYLDTAYFQNLV